MTCKVCGCTSIQLAARCGYWEEQGLCSWCFSAMQSLRLWIRRAEHPSLIALLRETMNPATAVTLEARQPHGPV